MISLLTRVTVHGLPSETVEAYEKLADEWETSLSYVCKIVLQGFFAKNKQALASNIHRLLAEGKKGPRV